MTVTQAPPDEPAAPARRHGALIAVVAIVVMVIAAIVFVVVGASAHSDASDDRDRADAVSATSAALAKQQSRIDDRRIRLRKLADAVPGQVGKLEAALTDVVTAQNQFIATVNQAASLYASGDHAGAANALRGDGATTVGQLAQRNEAVQQALQKAQAALDELRAAE